MGMKTLARGNFTYCTTITCTMRETCARWHGHYRFKEGVIYLQDDGQHCQENSHFNYHKKEEK
jgi:hypothetical protein